MEKRDNKIFMPSTGNRYLVMPGTLLHRGTTRGQCKEEDQLHAIEQAKKGVA